MPSRCRKQSAAPLWRGDTILNVKSRQKPCAHNRKQLQICTTFLYRRPRGTPTEATKTEPQDDQSVTKVQSTQRTQLRVQRGLAAGEHDGGLVVVGAARATDRSLIVHLSFTGRVGVRAPAMVSRAGCAPQIVHGDTVFTPHAVMHTAFVALQVHT